MDLTFRMINRSLLIAARDNLLATVRPLLTLFKVPGVNYLLLVPLQHLGRVRRVRTRCVATEASLIVIIHLLLRFQIAYVVLGGVLLLLVVRGVALVVADLVWVVLQHFGACMIAL